MTWLVGFVEVVQAVVSVDVVGPSSRASSSLVQRSVTSVGVVGPSSRVVPHSLVDVSLLRPALTVLFLLCLCEVVGLVF